MISGHGAKNTTRYIYFAPSASQIMKRELVKFTNTELAEDVSRKMLQSRYHVYPVTDADGHLTGYVSRYHIMQAPSKKLILVDHNEFSQSVRAIEKAQVLEVIRLAKLPPIPMKAVLTMNNLQWNTMQLYEELCREREAMEAQKNGQAPAEAKPDEAKSEESAEAPKAEEPKTEEKPEEKA